MIFVPSNEIIQEVKGFSTPNGILDEYAYFRLSILYDFIYDEEEQETTEHINEDYSFDLVELFDQYHFAKHCIGRAYRHGEEYQVTNDWAIQYIPFNNWFRYLQRLLKNHLTIKIIKNQNKYTISLYKEYSSKKKYTSEKIFEFKTKPLDKKKEPQYYAIYAMNLV